MTVSLLNALNNSTKEVEVLNVLHYFTVKTVVPATLLESFLFGTLFFPPTGLKPLYGYLTGASTAAILLGSYMLW